jgi:hypothetical protein
MVAPLSSAVIVSAVIVSAAIVTAPLPRLVFSFTIRRTNGRMKNSLEGGKIAWWDDL